MTEIVNDPPSLCVRYAATLRPGARPADTDTMVLTVRGLGGRVSHQFGDPGIVIATALTASGDGVVLVRDLTDINQGQSAGRAASYLASMVVQRLTISRPTVDARRLRWFDMTDPSAPEEWLVDTAVGSCSVGLYQAIQENTIHPPRPKLSERDRSRLPAYFDAVKALDSVTVRARRLF